MAPVLARAVETVKAVRVATRPVLGAATAVQAAAMAAVTPAAVVVAVAGTRLLQPAAPYAGCGPHHVHAPWQVPR